MSESNPKEVNIWKGGHTQNRTSYVYSTKWILASQRPQAFRVLPACRVQGHMSTLMGLPYNRSKLPVLSSFKSFAIGANNHMMSLDLLFCHWYCIIICFSKSLKEIVVPFFDILRKDKLKWEQKNGKNCEKFSLALSLTFVKLKKLKRAEQSLKISLY